MTADQAPVPPALYSRPFLEALAGENYREFLRRGRLPPLRPRVARSLALAGLGPGLFVVDVGCGRGEAAVRAAQRGAEVLALDFSLDAARLSHETALACLAAGTETALRRLWIVVADATALPVTAGSADRVLLLDIIEHLRPWQVARMLMEVRRILKPGGYVVIHTVPNRWALAVGYRVLRLWQRQLPASPRTWYERKVHVNEQDPWQLRRALAAAGLRSRVWTEEWTTRYARRSVASSRLGEERAAYRVLGRPWARRWSARLMATPLRWWVGNDIFALAWLPEGPSPPATGPFRAVR